MNIESDLDGNESEHKPDAQQDCECKQHEGECTQSYRDRNTERGGQIDHEKDNTQ